jgi:hypothetical protein
MRVTTLKMGTVGALLCGALAAAACQRTPQELERLMNEQAQKSWEDHHGALSSKPETYSQCHPPTAADARREDGQAYEAVCTERHAHLAWFSASECVPVVSVRTVGLFDEGQSVMARIYAGGPGIQSAYLSDPISLGMSDLMAARSRHTVQPCPESR